MQQCSHESMDPIEDESPEPHLWQEILQEIQGSSLNAKKPLEGGRVVMRGKGTQHLRSPLPTDCLLEMDEQPKVVQGGDLRAWIRRAGAPGTGRRRPLESGVQLLADARWKVSRDSRLDAFGEGRRGAGRVEQGGTVEACLSRWAAAPRITSLRCPQALSLGAKGAQPGAAPHHHAQRWEGVNVVCATETVPSGPRRTRASGWNSGLQSVSPLLGKNGHSWSRGDGTGEGRPRNLPL
ncbi:hypothetical protein H8959_001465 [Pygathrix nigripes]